MNVVKQWRDEFFAPSPEGSLRTSSNWLFIFGLILIALMMPLDRVKNLATTPPYPATLATLFLLQRPLLEQYRNIKNRQWRIPGWRFGVIIVLLLVSAVVSYTTAYDKPVARFATILLAFVAFRSWLLGAFIRLNEMRLLEKAILAMATVVVVFGYYQYVGDVLGLSQHWTLLRPNYTSTSTYIFPRIQSFPLEPLYLAHYLLLPIGILLVRFLRDKGKLGRFDQVLIINFVAMLVLTLSRGAIIGMLLSLGILMMFARSWRLVRFVTKVLLISAAIVGLLVAFAGGAHRNKAVSTFVGHAVNLDDASARTRYDLWPATLRLFVDHPVDGVGLNNSRLLLHNLPNTVTTAKADAQQPVNNDYLAFLAEQGVIGVILGLPLLFVILKSIMTTWRLRYLHPAGPYVFALVGMAFEANAFHSLLLLRTWVVIGLIYAGNRLYHAQSDQSAA